jgi:hypothetical protein
MSKRPATTLLYSGLGLGLILVLGSLAWPEARALGIGLGALIVFLAIALHQLSLVLSQIGTQLAAEPVKDLALENTLQALREGIVSLPAKLEAPMQKGQQDLNSKLSQELQGLSEKLQVGLVTGLREQGTNLGAALAVDLKVSGQDLKNVLTALRDQAKEQATSQSKEHAAALESVRSVYAGHMSEMRQQAIGDRDAWVKSVRAEFQPMGERFTSLLTQASEAMQNQMAQSTENLVQVHRTGLETSMQDLNQVFKQIDTSLTSVSGAIADQADHFQSIAEKMSHSVQNTTAETGEFVKRAVEQLSQSLQNHADTLGLNLGQVTEGLAHIEAAQARLAENAGSEIQKSLDLASGILVNQAQSSLQATEAVSHMAVATTKSQEALLQFETTAQINQVEMQGGIAMLNSALGNLLDRLEGQAQVGESQEAFLGKLEAALAAYQERSGEILAENALKTQEILMEALQVLDGRPEKSFLSSKVDA